MHVKVVSLNLWNGHLIDQALDFLASEQPDLGFFQEVYDGAAESLESRFRAKELIARQFPDHYLAYAPIFQDTRAKEGDIDNGQLLISRWPLAFNRLWFVDEAEYAPYDHDGLSDFSQFPAGVQIADVIIDSIKVRLMNVHGSVNFNGSEDDVRRLKLRQLILNHVDKTTIVAGDFNVRPNTQTIQGLSPTLTSAISTNPSTTFNLQRKDLVADPGYADSAVDYLFVTPNIHVSSVDLPSVDVSDHLPIAATLDLGE